MQCGGVEVGTVGPDERVTLRVESNLREKLLITERRKKFSRQHGKKVDDLGRTVGKPHPQRMVAASLEAGDPGDKMGHVVQLSGSMGIGR